MEGIIKEECDTAFGGGPRLHISMQESWLNKTTSLKNVRESIMAIIEKHLEDERRREALEQARQDRADAIENHVKGLNEKFGLNLPVSRFIVGMGSFSSAPLADVLADVEKSYAAALEQHHKQQEAMRSSRPASHPVEQHPVYPKQPSLKTEQTAPTQTRTMSIVFEYPVGIEMQVKACLEHLKKLCINFGARYRQE